MARPKNSEKNENIENETNEVKEVEDMKNETTQQSPISTDMMADFMKQMEKLKKMQMDFMQKQQEFEKEKEEFNKNKIENKQVYSPTSSNEFIEVICNIPKFEIDNLGAYDLGTRSKGNFIKLPKYGSRANIQFTDIQEISGYAGNGLLLGSILISKKNNNAIKDLGLEAIYENIVYPEDMDEFLKKDIEEIEPIIKKSPERMKEAFESVIRYKYNNGTLNCNINKLRRLEDILDTKF